MKRRLTSLFIAASAVAFSGCGEIPGLGEEESEENSTAAPDTTNYSGDMSASQFAAPTEFATLTDTEVEEETTKEIQDQLDLDISSDSAALALQDSSTSDDGGGDDDGPFKCMKDVKVKGSDGALELKGFIPAKTCLQEMFSSDMQAGESLTLSDGIIRFSFKFSCSHDFTSYDGKTLGELMETDDPMKNCASSISSYEQMSIEMAGVHTSADGSSNVHAKMFRSKNNGYDTVCEWTIGSDGKHTQASECSFQGGEVFEISSLSLQDNSDEGPENKYFKATSSDLVGDPAYRYPTSGTAALVLNDLDGSVSFSTTNIDWSMGTASGSFQNESKSGSMLHLKAGSSSSFSLFR